MKMDILFLRTLNPTLSLVETKSLFYNKFYYRIQIKAPGIRRHVYYKGDLAKISLQKEFHTIYSSNYNDKIDLTLNNCIYKIIVNNPNIKFRIEHPYISLYLQTEQDLDRIVSLILELNKIELLKEICAPNKITINDLADNTILVKKIPNRYQYKVVVKGGVGTDDYIQKRQGLSNYLYNLGNEVYCRNLNLVTDSKYYYNSTYFYCTDDKIILLLQLSYPDLIGKTFRVVKV